MIKPFGLSVEVKPAVDHKKLWSGYKEAEIEAHGRLERQHDGLWRKAYTTPSYYRHHEKNKERSRLNAAKLYLKMQKGSNLYIKRLLRARIWKAIRLYGNPTALRRKSRTAELIGCSIQQLRAHLEAKFTNGMTWANQGAWHIDHIKPCALFDLTNEREQRACFHYTNLQPLWASENIRKSDTYEPRGP